jgi:chorismate mutase
LAETQLGLPAADPEARVWWAGFRQLNADLWVNRVCQQLATERITLPKFVAAVRAADNPDWLSILVHARRGKGQT